jgi:anaerobic ribonucleoside-triphosphate reductase activating protein
MDLIVGRVLHGTTAEGPFLRSAIWVQGCSIRCAGCINPHLFDSGGATVDTDVLVSAIGDAGVEGVTFLGGEPFDQATPCAELAEALRTRGMGVITFSGRTHADLRTGPPGWQRLLATTDLLVDGPYVRDRPEPARSLVGSTNQSFVHLSPRYEAFDPVQHRNRVDIRIAPSGETRLAGFLTRRDLSALEIASPRIEE